MVIFPGRAFLWQSCYNRSVPLVTITNQLAFDVSAHFLKPLEGSGPLPVTANSKNGVNIGSELPFRVVVVDNDEATCALTTAVLESLCHPVAREDANVH
jgi:hypothetical protein